MSLSHRLRGVTAPAIAELAPPQLLVSFTGEFYAKKTGAADCQLLCCVRDATARRSKAIDAKPSKR
ncbi:MAG: hypothetical protein NW224_15250 [Leptolyngbyaceae cyanobacterium bins.302]|nr:hypothetical protein [Leptolyngbyaceae cyanobacterium bins.302]